MYNDSDEYDFNPSGSSKLASLFGDTKSSDDFNSSLTYTAPKQPKGKKEPDLNESTKSKPQTSVLLAKVISLWKLEENDYKSLGKHGLAVIGSSELNLYEIIAYKEKHNILLRRKINDKCSFYNKKDYFSTFYDNNNQNWLVKFENSDDQTTFSQTVQGYGVKVINKIEEATENNKIQTNATKEGTVINSEPTPIGEALEKQEVNSDSSGSQKRANILSRMAKMGQQILPSPLLKNTSTDFSDSELDDAKVDRKIAPRKFKRTSHTEKTISPKEEQLPQVVQQDYSENQVIPSQMNYNNYPMQLPQTIASPVYYNPPMQFDGFNNFIMAQNAELKMNLAQISAKLDNALSQGNNYSPKTDDATLRSKIKVLELRSANLQAELERYERKYNNLEKIYQDLEEKIHNDTAEHKESETVIENLREEIGNLHAKVRESEGKVVDREKLENELKECRDSIQECEKTIEKQRLKVEELEKFYEENKDNVNLQTTVNNLNETISSLHAKLKDSEKYYKKTEEEKLKRSEENDKIINTFSDKIKGHMNNMYQSIVANFQEGNSYSLSEINISIAQNLKSTTFKVINDLKDIYKSENDE